MKNLSRILSCLLIGILCAALLAGCFGSGTGIEALIQKVSAGYSTLTISTYDVDDSGNKELAEEFIYDAEGNILQEYEVLYYDDDNVYEKTYTYSYQKNGLISSMTFIQGNFECTFNYDYEYDDDGSAASVSADWYIEERDMTTTIYAILSYNTAGNISSVYYNTIAGSSDYSDGEIQEYVKSDDFLSDGVTVDFIYSFNTIEGIYSSKKVTYSSGEEDVYEIESTLEYDENGMIAGIGIQSTDSTPFAVEYYDVKFITAVLKYIDSIQNSNLAGCAEYFLYGGSDKDNTFLKIEYDDQGNVTRRSCSREYDRYYEEYPICSYEYEYEYNENGQIQTSYTYLDSEAYQISYYEYE